MSDLVVGVTECIETFEATPRQISAAIAKGMRKGLNVHKKAAIANLKSAVKGATRPSPKFNDTLVDAIISHVKPGDFFGELVGTLHTMGTNKKGSGTYRARFFEKGTVDRFQKTWNGKKLKKERYLGKLPAHRFFGSAAAGLDSTVSSEVQAEVEKTINKINQL